MKYSNILLQNFFLANIILSFNLNYKQWTNDIANIDFKKTLPYFQ